MRALLASLTLVLAPAALGAPPVESLDVAEADPAAPSTTGAPTDAPAEDVGDAEEADNEDTEEEAPEQPADREAADEGDLGEPTQAFAAGRYADAAQTWKGYIEERPDTPSLRYRLAVSAALAEDLATGRDAAAQAERLDPGNPAAIELAFALHKRLISKEKADRDTQRDLAGARRALADGRLRTAERIAARGLATQGDPPLTEESRAALHRIRGQALLALGKPSDAAAALKAAAGAGHHDPALLHMLTEVTRRTGDAEALDGLQLLADSLLARGNQEAPQEKP